MPDDFLQLITSPHSPSQLTPWMRNCAALFVLVVILFVWTTIRRHRMDAAMTFDGTLPSKSSTVPERRWTYDHAYVIRFLETLCRRAPASQPSYWIEFYAGPILELDILFSVCFAAFIVFASLLIAFYFGTSPWLLRASFLTSAMGIVYGFADVAEDLKLQSILRNAAQAYAKKVAATDTREHTEISLADAAEVDAANALTRIKIITVVLSLVGLVAFAVLEVVAALVIRVSSQTSGGAKPAVQG